MGNNSYYSSNYDISGFVSAKLPIRRFNGNLLLTIFSGLLWCQKKQVSLQIQVEHKQQTSNVATKTIGNTK